MLAYQFDVVTLHTPIKIAMHETMTETTVGRLIFNQALDGKMDYVNEIMTKPKISKLLAKIFEKHGMDATRDTIDRMKLLGFEMATVSGITWAMADLIIPPEKKEIMQKARTTKWRSSTTSSRKVAHAAGTQEPHHQRLGESKGRTRKARLRASSRRTIPSIRSSIPVPAVRGPSRS